jgi:hypothetical protein
MKTVFNFGGFYHSYFNDEIDEIINDEDVKFDVDNIDFKKLHKEVAKDILTAFNECLNSEHDIELKFKFIELDSPKFYNYTTDKILLEITNEDKVKLDLLVVNDNEVKEALEEIVNNVTTSRPGYMPYYNYDEVIAKVDEENEETYYQCLLDALYDKDEVFEEVREDLRNTVYGHL